MDADESLDDNEVNKLITIEGFRTFRADGDADKTSSKFIKV